MRKLIRFATVIAIIGAVGVCVSASSGAATAARITCRSTEYNPTPTQAAGVVVGLVRCSRPFGRGVISASYTSTFDPTTSSGTDNGPFRKWFLTGTLHGRYTGTYQFTSNTDASWENAITVSGGTGAFTGVKGKGSESCTSTSAGATLTCSEVLEVTGLYFAESKDQFHHAAKSRADAGFTTAPRTALRSQFRPTATFDHSERG